VPVIVNGDIVDTEAARTALAESGAAGVMLGRGAQGQPWRVAQIGAELAGEEPVIAPKGQALIELIQTHYQEMLSEYGIEVGLRAARKHLDWYTEAAGLNLDKPTRRTLLDNDQPSQVLS